MSFVDDPARLYVDAGGNDLGGLSFAVVLASGGVDVFRFDGSMWEHGQLRTATVLVDSSGRAIDPIDWSLVAADALPFGIHTLEQMWREEHPE